MVRSKSSLVNSYFEMAFQVMVFVIIVLITSPSSEARRVSLFEFEMGGSGDRTWNIALYQENGVLQSTSENGFKLGDTIHAKYTSGPVPILKVSKAEFESCKSSNPIHVFNNTDSTYKLVQPGPHYFISAEVEDCKRGHKQVIMVPAP